MDLQFDSHESRERTRTWSAPAIKEYGFAIIVSLKEKFDGENRTSENWCGFDRSGERHYSLDELRADIKALQDLETLWSQAAAEVAKEAKGE